MAENPKGSPPSQNQLPIDFNFDAKKSEKPYVPDSPDTSAAKNPVRSRDSGVASDQLPGVVEYEKLPRALVEHRGGGLAAAVGDLDEVDTKPESEGGGGGLSVSSVTLVTQLSLDRFAAAAALKSTKLGPLISIVIS